jgi:glutaminyl-peptide cyclotransferase
MGDGVGLRKFLSGFKKSRGEALLALLLLLAASPSWAEPRPVPFCSIRIVHVYPHDPTAFTQGLLFADGFLYESTGLHGESSLRKVNLETGEVVRSHALHPQYFGEGLTLWQDRLIQLTWKNGIAFVYDKESFVLKGTFTYGHEGWGLAHDGSSLIMSDGSATLRFLQPESFKEIRSVEVTDRGVPVRNLNELEYVRGEILANVWGTEGIAKISPATGEVVAWVDLSLLRAALGPVRQCDVLNGIAYDVVQNRLFVTGKLWPKLFQIEILP